tara:strand:+ start:6898 stop:7482 length:585 start_codon:yes stop_codon:yes gene_type:complete
MKINNYYIHRVNDIDSLENVSNQFGIEIDLRYENEEIILNHDPFLSGTDFRIFLKKYNHNGIILNCKSEGIENKILKILKDFNITNFFFLDLSIPFLIKTSNSGCKQIAVRFSEYEPIDFVKKYKDVCNWVWIDSFSGNYFDKNIIKTLSKNFKICLMSPELRGFDKKIIDDLKIRYKNIEFNGICTKNPDLWM